MISYFSLFFYNVVVRLYYLLIALLYPFNGKAKKWIDGRQKTVHFLKDFDGGDEKYVWFHCASLGEFEQGRPLIEKLREESDLKIIITFFSPSGYEIRKNYEFADHVLYMLPDSKQATSNFLNAFNIHFAVFVKYEFWFHHLTALKNRQIPVFLLSGIFRDNQLFFKPLGGFFRKMLDSFDFFFLQNERSLELLNELGKNNALVSGDTRFDRVLQVKQNAREIEQIEQVFDEKPVIVAGSTWAKDEELINRLIGDNPGYNYIIAPHNINDSDLEKLQRSIGNSAIRFSQIDQSIEGNYSVIIIDNIGMLSSLYRYGKIAYIGGGFGVSVHNILEASVYGQPVIFGPNYHKSQEAKDLLELKAAFTVNNYDDLKHAFHTLENEESYAKAAEINKKYVMDNAGGTELAFKHLQSQGLI